MKVLKLSLLVGGIAAISFGYGRLRSILKNNGSIIAYTPNNFYVFGVFPFDETYQDDIDDMNAAISAIFDEAMDRIEVDELERMYYEDD